MRVHNPQTLFQGGEKNGNLSNSRCRPTAIFFGIILLLLFSRATHAADGTPLWTNYYVGRSGDSPRAIAVDGSANVVVTGDIGSDFGTIKYSSAGVPLWTNLFNSAISGATSQGTALAIDGTGNVYVTGTLQTPTLSAFETLKYSGAGVPLWTNISTVGTNDIVKAVAVDGSGNVIVTGYSAGSPPNISGEYVTIEYSGAGIPVWTNTFNGSGGQINDALAVAVDGDGNVIVTGKASGSGSSFHYGTIKYSGAGAPLWTNLFNGTGNSNDTATAVAVDGNGNIVVTGDTYGSGSYNDFGTIKYSSGGVPLWTNTFNGARNTNDFAEAVAVDSSGNVYVTGTTTGIGSGTEYATIKYSSAGVPLWTNIFQGAGKGFDGALDLALDGSGDVYVSGNSTPTAGALPAETIIKYSTDGVPIWTNAFNLGGSNQSDARGLAVDGSGNVYATGYMEGTTPGYGYVTIKYSGPAAILTPLSFINSVYSTNGFSVVLIGPAGSNAVISASTNLQIWVPLLTNPLISGTLTFTDALATNYPFRFYRAALQ